MITVFLVLMNIAFAAAPADGSYLKPCYVVGDDYLASTVQVQKTSWIHSHTAYEDESCKTPYLIYEIRAQSQFQDSALDLITQEVSYTPLTSEVAEALNLVSYCGIGDWRKDQRKVVTGVLCDEFQTPKKGEVVYSNYRLSTNSSGGLALYLGVADAVHDGKTAANRFTTLEASPYLKAK